MFQDLAATEAARSGLEADLASTTERLDETAEALALKEAELEGTTAQLEQQLETARAEVRSTGRGAPPSSDCHTAPALLATVESGKGRRKTVQENLPLLIWLHFFFKEGLFGQPV